MIEKEKKQLSRKNSEEQLSKKDLADNPKAAMGQLTDEQLDKVAGGASIEDEYIKMFNEAIETLEKSMLK